MIWTSLSGLGMEVTPVQMHLKTLGADNVLLSDADHPWHANCVSLAGRELSADGRQEVRRAMCKRSVCFVDLSGVQSRLQFDIGQRARPWCCEKAVVLPPAPCSILGRGISGQIEQNQGVVGREMPLPRTPGFCFNDTPQGAWKKFPTLKLAECLRTAVCRDWDQ